MSSITASDVTFSTNGYQIKNFGDRMLERLFTFYQEGELTDFKIKADERIFKVHKLVMACSSDYFRAMLSHDMKETRQDFAEMKGLTARGTEPLIKYAYSGKLSLTQANIQEVVTGAMFLQMFAAQDLCIKYMLETLNFENSEVFLNIAEMYDIHCIKEHYNRYLLDNFLNFAETRTFLNLDAETLTVYLSDDTLQTTSEAALLHHVLRWYNYDQTNREHCVYDVLDKVKMTIDGWPTVHFARKTEPFISNPQCRELLQFAVNFMENADCRYLTDSHRTRVRFTRKTIVQFGGVAQYNGELDQLCPQLLTEHDYFGWSENNFFHLDRKCWIRLCCNADTRRRSHSAIIQFNSDFGVLIGGYEYKADSNTGILLHAVNDVKIFSTQGNPSIWDIKPLQHERARHTAVYLSGCIYVVGGKDNLQSLSSVEMLECNQVQWTYVRPLPNSLYDHAATVFNDKMYIAGGVSRTDVVTTVWCYTCDDKWKKKKSLISARAGHKMVCINNMLYTCGGYNTTDSRVLQCLNSMEIYDEVKNTWSTLSSMCPELAHFEMIVVDNKILVLGGMESTGVLSRYIHEYDPSVDQWSMFGELPRPLKNLSCCLVKLKFTDMDSEKKEPDNILAEYTQQWNIDTNFRHVDGLN